MKGKLVQWFKVPAVQAIAQETQPIGRGKVVGQGAMFDKGYQSTTVIVESDLGLLEELVLDKVQVVTDKMLAAEKAAEHEAKVEKEAGAKAEEKKAAAQAKLADAAKAAKDKAKGKDGNEK